ncbi:MAG: ABC transporter permease [Oscillospiraceae bacterium]|nr:ABC transporter permease [Oscillospiraceae bacterium]
MRKFGNLVKNEIIKLALRGSTQILAVLMVIMSVGICGIFYMSTNYSYDWYYDDGYKESDYYGEYIKSNKNEIESLERRLADYEENPEKFDEEYGYKDYNYVAEWKRDIEYYKKEIERMEFCLEHNIDNGWRSTDWRSDYINMVFERDSFQNNSLLGFAVTDSIRESVKTFLAEDDWRGLYTFFTESQKAASLLMGADSEMVDILTYKFTYALEHDIPPLYGYNDESWKNTALDNLVGLKVVIYEFEQRGSDKSDDIDKMNMVKDEAAILQYRLDRNLERVVDYSESVMGNMTFGLLDMGYSPNYYSGTDVWTMLEACVMMISFLSVFIVIIAGGLVSGEFTRGTIKFLLISPVKRWKIIVSKYIVMLLTALAFLTVMFTIFFVIGGAMTGFINMDAVNLTAHNERVTAVPALLYYIQIYLLGAVSIIIISTLAFALSSVTRNSGLSIAVSIAVLIGGQIIDLILHGAAGVDWGRDLIFANSDLIGKIYGSMNMLIPYKGHTLQASVAVIVVHMVIFLLMAWDGFTKKEI